MRRYGLIPYGLDDLSIGGALDDILSALISIVERHPIPPEAIEELKALQNGARHR